MSQMPDVKYEVIGKVTTNLKDWMSSPDRPSAVPAEIYFRDLDGTARRLVIYAVKAKIISPKVVEVVCKTDQPGNETNPPMTFGMKLIFSRRNLRDDAWSLRIAYQSVVKRRMPGIEVFSKVLLAWRFVLLVTAGIVILKHLASSDLLVWIYILGWGLALPHLAAWYLARAVKTAPKVFWQFGMLGLMVIGVTFVSSWFFGYGRY